MPNRKREKRETKKENNNKIPLVSTVLWFSSYQTSKLVSNPAGSMVGLVWSTGPTLASDCVIWGRSSQSVTFCVFLRAHLPLALFVFVLLSYLSQTVTAWGCSHSHVELAPPCSCIDFSVPLAYLCPLTPLTAGEGGEGCCGCALFS